MGGNREMLQRYALAVVSHLLLVAGVVPLRRARTCAEVRPAVALRHGPGAARSELPLGRERAGHRRRNLRRLCPCRRRRHRHRAAVLVVAGARDVRHAAPGQPQHDPEGGAGSPHHRLVPLRHRAKHDDGIRHLLLSDRAHHRAGAARSRARPDRPGALGQGLALADFHQDPACPTRCPTSFPA